MESEFGNSTKDPGSNKRPYGQAESCKTPVELAKLFLKQCKQSQESQKAWGGRWRAAKGPVGVGGKVKLEIAYNAWESQMAWWVGGKILGIAQAE